MLIPNEESELEENEWLLKGIPLDPSVITTFERSWDFIVCSSSITFADTLQREAIRMPTDCSTHHKKIPKWEDIPCPKGSGKPLIHKVVSATDDKALYLRLIL